LKHTAVRNTPRSRQNLCNSGSAFFRRTSLSSAMSRKVDETKTRTLRLERIEPEEESRLRTRLIQKRNSMS
jgi:hypothetical protein